MVGKALHGGAELMTTFRRFVPQRRRSLRSRLPSQGATAQSWHSLCGASYSLSRRMKRLSLKPPSHT